MFPLIYPLVMLVGFGAAALLLKQRYRSSPLRLDQRSALGIALFVGCMIGAKLPFLLGMSAGVSPLMWLADGKTILGGIFGGYLTVEVTKRWMGIEYRTGDYFAAPLALAVAIGRIGCFVGGCCFGAVTTLPWGLQFPMANDAEGICRHPTQLYESAFHLTAFGLILLAERKGWLQGYRLSVYLASYLIYRFLTEFIRPEIRVLGPFTTYQIACVMLLCFLGMIEWHYAAHRK